MIPTPTRIRSLVDQQFHSLFCKRTIGHTANMNIRPDNNFSTIAAIKDVHLPLIGQHCRQAAAFAALQGSVFNEEFSIGGTRYGGKWFVVFDLLKDVFFRKRIVGNQIKLCFAFDLGK